MITFTHASTVEHIAGIKALQDANHPGVLTETEKIEQGFVTCDHTEDVLSQMNSPHAHTIATENGELVAYALSMIPKAKSFVPILEPMFDKLDMLSYAGSTICDFNYIVMGQICIHKAYRGQSVFYQLYNHMRHRLAPFFELCITEVSCHNTRSLRAHEKQGFDVAEEYEAPDGHPWRILVWDWRGEINR